MSSIDKLADILYKEFVFKSSLGDYIIQETYPNSDENITIHGLNVSDDIVISDNKYIFKNHRRKALGTHEDFTRFQLIRYNSVKFVEESKAQAVIERIQEKRNQGRALMELWKVYSEKELEKSLSLKDSIGDLNYSEARDTADNIKTIKLNLTDDQKKIIKEKENDLKMSSLDKVGVTGSSMNSYKIKSVYRKYNSWLIDLYDEDDTLDTSGVLCVSTKGDETVNKRRKKAQQTLEDNANLLLRNLHFAIEDEADSMIEQRINNENAITPRTRKFLKEKFGVDSLTEDQEEAVRIAINTPDIAVIQGPPGTGKSTVIAVICDRLIEISEKNNKKLGDKQPNVKNILASAFQNDTVEHIASKIETNGLPTIKLGKASISISAEDITINKMIDSIDNSLKFYSNSTIDSRYSVKLKQIKQIYEKEYEIETMRRSIQFIVNEMNLSEELWSEWIELNRDESSNSESYIKILKALRNLSTDAVSYDDNGYNEVRKLLRCGITFTAEETDILKNAPIDEPEDSFLEFLLGVKSKYIDVYETGTTVNGALNLQLLVWIDDAISYMKEREESAFEDDDTFIASILESLREDLSGQTEYIRKTIKEYGESIAATNQKAGSLDMENLRFNNVILEEAARSNPLDLLIPMTRALKKIIMVGDQKQLPQLIEPDIVDAAVEIHTDNAKREYLRKSYEQSLFGIIYKNLEKSTLPRRIQLKKQFRMHPAIGEFIGQLYYDGTLETGLADQADRRKHNLSIPELKGKVMAFCDVDSSIGSETKGIGKCRIAEAKRVISLVQEIMADPKSENLSIGIITFYSKQVDQIFEAAEQVNLAVSTSTGDYEINDAYKITADGREKLRIGTVDSFQGKEFDIVILSTVRSNQISEEDENFLRKFGFLTLDNRLNVAFSRAQRLLIVCGDSSMFSSEFAKRHVEGLYEFYVNQTSNSEYGTRFK